MWQKETAGGLGLEQRFWKSKPHSEKEKEYQVSSQTRSGEIQPLVPERTGLGCPCVVRTECHEGLGCKAARLFL